MHKVPECNCMGKMDPSGECQRLANTIELGEIHVESWRCIREWCQVSGL